MYKDLYNSCKKIIKEAGSILESEKKKDFKIIRKSHKELVTQIDLTVQNFISNSISSICDFDIYYEEDKNTSQTISLNKCFIIDPIDGTHNMVAGLPFYNLSLGCVVNGEPVFGIIYFPYSGEMYHAYKGQGAYKNLEKISVSQNTSLEKSIIAYDNQFHLDPKIIINYHKLLDSTFTTRILGSANRDACYVAEGVLDARVWNSTKVYDIIAGLIIVLESGGCVTDFNFDKINLTSIGSVVMSNPGVHKDLTQLLD